MGQDLLNHLLHTNCIIYHKLHYQKRRLSFLVWQIAIPLYFLHEKLNPHLVSNLEIILGITTKKGKKEKRKKINFYNNYFHSLFFITIGKKISKIKVKSI
jgi:hypothetical protein